MIIIFSRCGLRIVRHVLRHFERARQGDERVRNAIGLARAWARGELTMRQARKAACAGKAAREVTGRRGTPRCLLVRLSRLHTLPRMSSGRRLMRSGRLALRPPRMKRTKPRVASALGSGSACRVGLARSCWMIRRSETRSAGLCLADAEGAIAPRGRIPHRQLADDPVIGTPTAIRTQDLRLRRLCS